MPTTGLETPEVLHLGDQPGQRGLGGGGGDDQQVLLAQVVQHLEDGEPGGDLEQGAQDDHDEHHAGGVEDASTNMPSAPMAAQPALPTTPAMAPNAPIGASHMMPAEDLEDQPLQHGDEVQHRLALGAQRLHGEADDQRDEQGLQHRAVGQRGEQRGRDDVDEEVAGASRPPGPCRWPLTRPPAGRHRGGSGCPPADPRTRAKVDITMK